MKTGYIDSKKIKGIIHYLYTTQNFTDSYQGYGDIPNWRTGKEGEWVLTDDNCVVQILKRGYITDKAGTKKPYIRTICGTYSVDSNSKMKGEIAENIYTFSRTNEYSKFIKRKDTTSREILFAKYVSGGCGVVESYTKAYTTNNKSYAKTASTRLLKTKRIQDMISEETRKVLDEEGVSDNYLIRRYKRIADVSENDGYVLRSLDSLSKMSGLFNVDEKKTEQLTVWTGFTPEQLEAIKQEKLVAIGEKEE